MKRGITMRRKAAAIIAVTILTIFVLLFSTQITDIFNYSVAALSSYGSTGQEVINIQNRLSAWGYYRGGIDGIYGYLTYSAVRDFQVKNGLTVDGIAGPETLAALGLPTGAQQGAGGGNYTGDLYLLAG